MYSFLVDFVHLVSTGQVRYFLLFFFIIWLRWFVVNSFAAAYKPVTAPFEAVTSVIIPVVDEDPELFKSVLVGIKKAKPFEIIVIINGPKNKALERICREIGGVNCHWTRTPGKRNALKAGMRYVTGDITVLVDSDTIWNDTTLVELVKPFADPKIGGVTTRQRIINPTVSLLSRFCDWLEDVRGLGTLPAMSVIGNVGCLPGRTIAFRTTILKKVMPEFMKEKFLGFHKEVSDDRSLTNLTLRAGYKTVLQSTSVVLTDAPETWRKFMRQQLRWSEGSQYNNVKMSGWMFKNARLMFFIYWTDTLLPFMLWGMYGGFIINLAFLHTQYSADTLIGTHNILIITAVTMIGAYISYSIRQIHVIARRPLQLIFVPFYILLLSLMMAPIRMIGFSKLADDLGWGTRKSAYVSKKRQLRLPFAASLTLRIRHAE